MGSLTGNYGLTYRAHLRAHLLGFWVLIYVVGRKCHIGVSWRGAHMMGSLTGSLAGSLTDSLMGSLTGFIQALGFGL